MLKNIFELSFSSVIILITGFTFSILIARILGPDILGQYFFIITTYSILEKILNPNTWQTLVYYGNTYETRSQLFNLDFIFYTLASVIFVIIGFKLFDEIDTLILMLGGGTLVSNSFNLSLGILRIESKFKKLALLNALPNIARLLLLLIIMPFINIKLEILVLIFFISFIPSNLYKYKILINQGFSFNIFVNSKKLIKYTLINSLNTSIKTIPRNLDVYFVKFLMSDYGVGILKLMKDITAILAQISDPIFQVLFPTMKKEGLSFNDNKIRNIFKFSIISAIVSYVIFLLIGENVINLLWGKDFSSAFSQLKHYIIPTLISIIFIPLYASTISNGKHLQMLYSQIISTLICVISWFILVPYFSFLGLSIGLILFKIFEITYLITLNKKI